MRKTKLAMLQSVVALILCAAMLVGTTFAWFTDSVTSGVNKIRAGNLDVDLVDAAGNSLEGTSLTFMDVTGNTDILWEPGCTFKTQGFRVANRGSLALEYTMYINGLLGDSKLLEAIDFSVQDADGYTVDIDTFEGQLSPKASSDVFYLVGHMDENAGNEYMNLTLTGIGITVYATQAMEESDAFGPEYDKDAFFPGLDAPILGSVNITTENDLLTADAVIVADGAKVTIPAGTRVEPGTTTLKLRVKLLEETSSNVQLGVNEVLQPMDVTVEGISEDNHQPLTVELSEIAPVGLNMGSIALHHVHNGTTVTMTRVAADAAFTADNQYRYDPATGDLALHMATFSEVAVVADTENAWEGDVDHSWYDADATELTIANADQLWSFSQIVGGMNGKTQDSFAGKTVKLIADINLGDKESENNPNIIFYPIGYYNSEGTYERTNTAITSGLRNFEGTFDGNGHTVSNFYQNTWEMKGDHDWYSPEEQYYRDGMGLFGRVYKCTVKNLTIKNFSSDGEITTTGCVAAYADGATFENIAIFNCNPRVYNIGNGGIVGCVGWYAKEADLKTTFTNITVDNSNKISALWGSYDVACGGIVGQYYPTSGQSSAEYPVNAGLHFENCHVSAVMDVYNDVCANYQYYAYRYTGMLIGSVRENETIDGHVYPKMDGITAKDCTVHFGDWNDYYYCELVANSLASYTHDHQMSRLEQVASVDVLNKTVTDLAGKTMAIPTSGRVNYVVVKAKDANGMWIHGDGHDYAECYHFVNGVQHFHDVADTDNPNPTETVNGVAGVLKEDKQLIYREFNNLVTGYGWGVTSKGVDDLAGVEILDRLEGNSVDKFVANSNVDLSAIKAGDKVSIGQLFTAIANVNPEINAKNVVVSVTDLTKTGITADFTRGNTWAEGTLKFNGTNGFVRITIQDYYFCNPTSIVVEVGEFNTTDRFELKFPNTAKYLYRVGNMNAISISSLFGTKDGVAEKDIGKVNVVVTDMSGNEMEVYTAGTGSWTSGSIDFAGDYTGPVQIAISDDNYSTPLTLNVEVVDATNLTSATGTTSGGNFVLLCDVNTTSYVNYWNCTLFGNGFTYSLKGAPTAYNSKQGHGVLITKNATLDNLVIVGDVYNSYGAYTNQDYYNAAVDVLGETTIQNCYIANCAAPVLARASVTITDTTLYGGTVANLLIKSGVVTLENVTTANYDDGRSLVGMGIVIHSDATEATKLVLNGTLTQYNFISEAKAPSDSNAKMLYDAMFGNGCSKYHFGTSPNRYVNAGIISMTANFGKDNIVDNAKTGYEGADVTVNKVDGYVYTQLKTSGAVNNSYNKESDSHIATTQGAVPPSYSFDYTNKNYVAKQDGSNDYCYEENGIVYISMDEGDSFNWDTSILTATKLGQTLSYTVSMNNADYTGKSIVFNTAGSYEVKYTYTDKNNYGMDAEGNIVTYSKTYTKTVYITVATVKAAWKNAEINVTKTAMSGIYVMSGDYDYSYKMKFLDCLTITDYDEAGKASTVDLSKNIKSTSFVDKNGANPGKFDANSGTITITYNDGKILTVSIGAWSGSGPSTKTCSVKTDDGLYLITDGASNAANTGVTWKITGYTYTGNNGALVSNNTAITFTWDTNSEGYNSKSSGGCFTPDTLITLADGTQKRVDELTFGDKILVWDFFTGTYVEKDIALLVNHGESLYRIANLAFSDGTALRIIAEHGVFDYDLNKFVYITVDNMHEYVGHRFVQYARDGSYSIVTMTDAYETEEYTSAWSITSAGTSNAFASGLLTVAPPEDFYNWIEMDGKLHYDVEQFREDVQTYGLYTYEDFKDYVTYEQFVDWNGAYLKIAVEKGYFTFDYILELIELYKGWMPNN